MSSTALITFISYHRPSILTGRAHTCENRLKTVLEIIFVDIFVLPKSAALAALSLLCAIFGGDCMIYSWEIVVVEPEEHIPK